MKYAVRVLMIRVHSWTDEQGEGEHVCNKGGYRVGEFPTLQAALADVREQFDDYDVNEGGFIQTSLIEDADAYPDKNGDYIAHYDIIIERVERVNVEELEA